MGIIQPLKWIKWVEICIDNYSVSTHKYAISDLDLLNCDNACAGKATIITDLDNRPRVTSGQHYGMVRH